MKKLLSIALILVLVLSCLLVFSACTDNKDAPSDGNTTDDSNDQKDETTHVHNFGEWEITKNASCKESGQKSRYCSCGETQNAEVPTLNHTEVIDEASEPTCKKTGLTEGKHCTSCGNILVEQKTVPVLDHTEVIDEAVEATCKATGLTEGKHCSVCNDIIIKQETVSVKDHTVVIDEAVEATCKATGLTEGKHCSVCNDVLVKQETVSLKDHTYVIDEAVEATCKATGLTEGKHCSFCKEVLVAQEIVDKKSHVEGEWIIDKHPSETQEGKKRQVCASCGETLKEDTIPATTPVEIFYKVEFKDYDGTVLKTVSSVKKGTSVTSPADPYREGYRFIGWDKSFTNVTSNLVVTAKYEQINGATLVVETVSADSDDDIVKVNILFLNNPGVASLKFNIAYGSDLVLNQVLFNSDFGAYVTAPEPYKNPQTVSVMSPTADIDADGLLVTLVFKIDGNVSANDSIDISLTIDRNNTFNSNFSNVNIGIVNGKINIK